MKIPGQLRWQRLIALLSVLAVFFGLSAHESSSSRTQASLSPAPLPELRAAPPPLGGPGVVGELAMMPVQLPRISSYAPVSTRPPQPGFAPKPLTQSGAKRLEGG